MKWFLIFCFLLPLNLFAERDVKVHDDWFDVLDIDDFTDKKVFIVSRWAEDKTNKFAISFTPLGAYLYTIYIPTTNCAMYYDDISEVLFRVDKNEVFTLSMKKNPQGLFVTDPSEITKGDMFYEYVSYQEEMSKGDILRIRVNDKYCKIDLKFDLKGFDKAIERLREALKNSIN